MWFDSHCHLYDCGHAPVAEVVARARAEGVGELLVPGVDADSSRAALALAHEHALWAAVGWHPSEARGWTQARMEEIEQLLGDDRAVAVGEMGLDFHWDTSFVPDQREAFVAQLELAARHDRVLVVHTRDSVDAALDLLEERGPARALFHCWSGDSGQLQRALSLGAYVSFAGNVTFRSAGDLRALAASVPHDRLLVETDSPYLTPVPYRGKPNEPARVVLVGRAVARARGVPEEELAEATAANARRAFGLK